MNEVNIDGLVLSANVIETVVAIAAEDVAGVASIGQAGTTANLMSMIGQKPQNSGVDFSLNEDKSLNVGVHIDVIYGNVLPEVADKVREAVAQAMTTQLGVEVGEIDIYIDGIRFE